MRGYRLKQFIKTDYQPLFEAIAAGISSTQSIRAVPTSGWGWLHVDAEVRRFIVLHLGEAGTGMLRIGGVAGDVLCSSSH